MRVSLFLAGMGLPHLEPRGGSADHGTGWADTTQTAIARLDESFFRARYDRLTPRERDYLRAMAEIGPGAHRSGDIAARMA